jgi:thioredoxin 1
MPTNVIEVNESNWKSEVVDSDIPVLVDFYAVWCGPCKMLLPTMEKIAVDFKEKVKVVKINTETSQKISNLYNISAMPSVVFFNKGNYVQKIVGVNPESKYVNEINNITRTTI